MSDLRLKDGDLWIQDFDLSLTDPDSESLAQRLSIKLQFFKGEWFLDIDFGIPYFQEIFVKPFIQSAMDAIFKNQILATPDVVALVQYASQFNRSQRTFAVEFIVKTKSNNFLEIIQSISL